MRSTLFSILFLTFMSGSLFAQDLLETPEECEGLGGNAKLECVKKPRLLKPGELKALPYQTDPKLPHVQVCGDGQTDCEPEWIHRCETIEGSDRQKCITIRKIPDDKRLGDDNKLFEDDNSLQHCYKRKDIISCPDGKYVKQEPGFFDGIVEYFDGGRASGKDIEGEHSSESSSSSDEVSEN